MIIAITAVDADLKSLVEPRFGRAPFFIIADTDTLEVYIHDNAAGVNAGNGAGTQAAQTLSEYGVERLYTGRVGPKAAEVLDKAGIVYHEETTGTIEEVLQAVSAELPPPVAAATPNVDLAVAEVGTPAPDAFRLAVPANDETGLTSSRSGHFGKCKFYTLVDIREGEIIGVHPMRNGGHVTGGCLVPVQLLKSWSVGAVVVSGIGGRPLQGFRAEGIEVYAGQGDTVQETVQAYINGSIQPIGSDQVCGGGA